MKNVPQMLLLVLLSVLLAACGNDGEETAVTAVPPTATPQTESTQPAVPAAAEQDFIIVATDAPHPPYSFFDDFGVVDGFDSRVLEAITSNASLAYELIVTPYEGVLENIANRNNRDFDAVIANLVIPEIPPLGITFTDPYLEIGQVIVVLADNETLQSAQDIQPGMVVGAAQNSQGEVVARELVGVADPDLQNHFENGVQALQALINEEVTAVIIDSTIAEYYTASLSDQIKIVGGNGRDAWLTSKAYGIATAEDDPLLREKLNAAIRSAQADGAIEREISNWLIPNETLEPGESRVGTPTDELFIGILGDVPDMDPANQSDLIAWEVKNNTMSGLYRFNSNNELVPLLASALPVVSEDGLEYTITLQPGLTFPDGTDLNADDVKWSVDRARSLGNFSVNSILKDSDDNFYADDDSVQVVDPLTVKFVLQEPLSTFTAVLATPPFFPINSSCYNETWDNASICGGLGPYTILDWIAGDRMRLQANPAWPGQPAPAFSNITLRFYDDPASLRRSLEEFGSVDIAWRGLPYSDFTELQTLDSDQNGTADFVPWLGPADFKSYLMFNHEAEPWDKPGVRRAVALALDRPALAAETFAGSRLPLLSPVPDAVPGHVPTLPARNLAEAQALLQAAGYSEAVPLEIELWYVNDGRYSNNEEAYANALKAQLEETGIFKVNLANAAFDQFRAQVSECNYPFYLLGWPSPGRPVDYLDVMPWTEFFVTSNSFCSNYESPAMTELVEAIFAETDNAARLALYEQMQQEWAKDLPTLDVLQEPTRAISLPNVDNVNIDALGLLHYEALTKGGG